MLSFPHRAIRIATAIAVAAACTLPAARASAAAPCAEQVEFVGFSRNERALALRTVASCRRDDGSVDKMVLVKVIDAATGRTQATYEESPSWSVRHGRRHLLGRGALAAAYPSLARVQGANVWRQVRAAGAFTAHRHDFADASVRLRLDDRVAADAGVQVRAEDKSLFVSAQRGAEVGFTVVARLADGEHVELGHFLRPANYAAAAALSVYTSKPGHRVALLWQVGGRTHLTTYSTPTDARFGSNAGIGAVNAMSGTADEVETLYKTMHPNSAKSWDAIVGELD